MALKDAVLQYCALSGQAVNMGKSSVSFSSRLHHRHVRMLVRGAMGIRRNLGVWTYLLGLPISGKRLKKNDFTRLLERGCRALNPFLWGSAD